MNAEIATKVYLTPGAVKQQLDRAANRLELPPGHGRRVLLAVYYVRHYGQSEIEHHNSRASAGTFYKGLAACG